MYIGDFNLNDYDDYITFLYNYTDLSDDLRVELASQHQERQKREYEAIFNDLWVE